MANTYSSDNSSSNTPLLILVGIGIPFIFMVFVVYFYGIGERPTLKPVQLSTGEWAPYTGEDLPSLGVATAIVSDVMRDIGYEPHYQFMSWPVALERAESSKTDDEIRGSFPYIATEERQRKYYISDPVMHYEITAFYNKHANPDAAAIESVADLSGHQIVKIAGYDYPKSIREHISSDTVSASDLDTAFRLIANNDNKYIVVESIEVGSQLLEQKHPRLVEKIQAAPLRKKTSLHLLFSKNNPNNRTLSDDFNRSLARLQKNPDAFKAFQNTIKRKIDMARSVQLEPFGEQDRILAYTDISKEKFIILPRGNRAIVKQWGSQFFLSSNDLEPTSADLVRVKLLNGPMKGHELYVDGRAIHLP